MDPTPDHGQEENYTDPELLRLEGEKIYLWSECLNWNLIVVMGAQLFKVSLRTFREDYIKGKN